MLCNQARHLGFLYVDGHTRAYFGTREVQKTHVARLKFPAPATEETWVTGQSGDPMTIRAAGFGEVLRGVSFTPGTR